MDQHCYYCGQIFDSKEKLYDHLEVHSKPESEQQKVRAKWKKAKTLSRKTTKLEGKVSASQTKKKFTVSQKRMATIKKSRH